MARFLLAVLVVLAVADPSQAQAFGNRKHSEPVYVPIPKEDEEPTRRTAPPRKRRSKESWQRTLELMQRAREREQLVKGERQQRIADYMAVMVPIWQEERARQAADAQRQAAEAERQAEHRAEMARILLPIVLEAHLRNTVPQRVEVEHYGLPAQYDSGLYQPAYYDSPYLTPKEKRYFDYWDRWEQIGR